MRICQYFHLNKLFYPCSGGMNVLPNSDAESDFSKTNHLVWIPSNSWIRCYIHWNTVCQISHRSSKYGLMIGLFSVNASLKRTKLFMWLCAQWSTTCLIDELSGLYGVSNCWLERFKIAFLTLQEKFQCQWYRNQAVALWALQVFETDLWKIFRAIWIHDLVVENLYLFKHHSEFLGKCF